MTTLHHIGELLQSGVRPTDEETEHLRSLGGFVAEMFGRYLTGDRETLSSGPDGWSSRLAGRLSAANGARWEQGLGLGEMFLASDLTSFWQVAKGGFAEGYGSFEADRSMLELYEEEVAPQPEAAVEAAPRRRRPSLFGAKGGQAAQSRPGRVRTSQGERPSTETRPVQAEKSSSALRAARWADGGTAEMTVVKALASGGLFVGDQVSQLIAESGEIFSRSNIGSRTAGAAAPGTSTSAGRPSAIASAGRSSAVASAPGRLGQSPAVANTPSVSLDGLRIDSRTPALASALARAEAVFGRGDSMVKPAVAASRMDKLGSIVPFSMEGVDRGYGLGERPVYGFYDAAETTYVNLASEPSATADAGVEAPATGRGGRVAAGRSAARRQTLQPSARAQRQVAREQAVVQASGKSATGLAPAKNTVAGESPVTRLDSLVRPANSTPGTAPLRPLTAASLGSSDVSIASRFVHTPAGVAAPHVQRGSGFAPRIALTQLGAPGSQPAFVFDAAAGRQVPSAQASEVSALAAGGQQGGQTSSFAGTGLPVAARYTQMQALEGLLSSFRSATQGTPTYQQGASVGAAGPSNVSPAAAWRLAADAGPDVPVGAGFTGPEVFAALVRSQRGGDVRQAGVGFRPTVASGASQVSTATDGAAQPARAMLGAGAAGGSTPSRLADLVDGLVWVSLPGDGQEAGQASDNLDGLGLSAVPTGRRSAMVPASAALGAIASRTTGLGRAELAQRLSSLGVAELAQITAGNQASSGDAAASPASQVVAGRFEKATGLAALSAGLVPQTPRFAADGLIGSAAGDDGGARAGMARSNVGQDLSSRALSSAADIVGGTFAPVTSGGLAASLAADSAAPIGLRSVSGGYRGAQGWTPGVISDRLAQTVEGAVSSGYGRLDAERVMLAVSSTEAPVGVAGDTEGALVMSRGAGRRLSGRIDGRRAARSAGDGAVEARRGVASGAASVSPEQQAAFAARQALLRPVPTAREARAVANVFSGQGAIGRQLGHGSVSGVMAMGSDEPVLGRLVSARAESGGQLAAAASRWETSPELVARLASLEGGARRELGQTLRMAGWNDVEIAMLRLDVGDSAAAPGSAAGEVGQGGKRASAFEGSKARLDASRMSRSFARVVAGAEGLGGPVSAGPTVTANASTGIAGKAAASPMPMLEGRLAGSDYFGALATSGPVAGYGSLRDELGELVKMAEVVSAQADEPAALEAQQGLVARARSVLARSSGADRGAAAKLLARLESVASKAQAAGRSEQAGLLGAVARSMGGVGVEAGVPGAAGIEGFASRAASGFVSKAEAEIGVSAQGFEAQLARIEGAADATTMGFGRVGGASRAMDFDDVEMSVLALEREVAPSIEARVAQALALSTSGPAGARRLLGGAGPGARSPMAGRLATGAEGTSLGDRPARGERPVVGGASEADRQQQSGGGLRAMLSALGGGSALQRQLASLAEELGGNLPLALNRVIAPEAMLHGLRSPELSAAMKTIRARQQVLGAEMTRVLATLADSGVDLSAARSSLSAVAREYGLTTDIERFAAVPAADGGASIRGYESTSTTSELAGESPEQAFLQLLSDSVEGGGAAAGSRSLAQVAAMVRRGGLSRTQRAGLLSSLLRGTERAERTSLLEEAGGSEFAFAWLSRVDGSKTGLDIGLGETREEFGRAFGGRRDSAVSMDSPISQASLVAPISDSGAARVSGTGKGISGAGARGAGAGAGGAAGADKSGLRSLASTVTHTSTGAARPQHGASQAVRRTDWSFVDTGSRASTTHADLGRLASAIVSSSESGQRAPMPLVAPAVKAVAQTALRDSKTSSAPSQPAGGSGGAPADAGRRGPVDAKMSEKAIEMLAVEMANRVARLMGLMKERIGVWS